LGMNSIDFLYGTHAVLAALQNPKRTCVNLFLTPKTEGQLQEKGVQVPKSCQVHLKDKAFFDQKCGEDAVHQFMALEAHSLPPLKIKDVQEAALLLVLDQVTDPHNIGAILRSAAAFGASALITQDKHSPKMTPVIAKTACGALEHIPLISVTNLSQTMEQLKKKGFFCYGLDEKGTTSLPKLQPAAQNILVLGAEGKGLRRLVAESCDEMVRLPMTDAMPSINVSNAAAVALYHLSTAIS